eukprot:scaffold3473_cov122-Isochrysis_galbana.AAC.8
MPKGASFTPLQFTGGPWAAVRCLLCRPLLQFMHGADIMSGTHTRTHRSGTWALHRRAIFNFHRCTAEEPCSPELLGPL